MQRLPLEWHGLTGPTTWEVSCVKMEFEEKIAALAMQIQICIHDTNSDVFDLLDPSDGRLHLTANRASWNAYDIQVRTVQ